MYVGGRVQNQGEMKDRRRKKRMQMRENMEMKKTEDVKGQN